MLDDVQKIDRMIETMCQLKELEKKLRVDMDAHNMITILALISSVEIPQVTLLTDVGHA